MKNPFASSPKRSKPGTRPAQARPYAGGSGMSYRGKSASRYYGGPASPPRNSSSAGSSPFSGATRPTARAGASRTGSGRSGATSPGFSRSGGARSRQAKTARAKKSFSLPGLPVKAIGAILLLAVIAGGGYWFFFVRVSVLELDASQYPLEVRNAVYDAHDAANNLVGVHNDLQDRRLEALEATDSTWAYEAAVDPAVQSADQADAQARETLMKARARIEDAHEDDSSDRGLKAYLASIDAVVEAIDLERAIFAIRADYVQATRALTEHSWSASAYEGALDAKAKALEQLAASETYGDIIREYADEVAIEKESLAYLSSDGRASSPLYAKQFEELVDWGMKAAVDHELDISALVNHAIVHGRDLSSDGAKNPVADANTEPDVMPNVYSRGEGLGMLTVSVAEDQDILIRAELPGFTERLEQTVHAKAGNNFYRIKPAMLAGLSEEELAGSREGQIDIDVLSANGKKRYLNASEPVTVYSIYDMVWGDTLRGSLRKFDILAWIRPEDAGIHKLLADAAQKLPELTGGAITEISEANAASPEAMAATVAALQLAITDHNMTYARTGYSFKASQHVLTADQVLAQKHGVCIETSLLMASALEAAGFHALLVFPPGHTQVAVEIEGGSTSRFLLVETTLHPYETSARGTWKDPSFYRGLLRTDAGGTFILDPRQWQTEIDQYDDYYVVDTTLSKVMDLHGYVPAS